MNLNPNKFHIVGDISQEEKDACLQIIFIGYKIRGLTSQFPLSTTPAGDNKLLNKTKVIKGRKPYSIYRGV